MVGKQSISRRVAKAIVRPTSQIGSDIMHLLHALHANLLIRIDKAQCSRNTGQLVGNADNPS